MENHVSGWFQDLKEETGSELTLASSSGDESQSLAANVVYESIDAAQLHSVNHVLYGPFQEIRNVQDSVVLVLPYSIRVVDRVQIRHIDMSDIRCKPRVIL